MANSQTIVVVVDFERDVAITAAPGDVLSYRDCFRFSKTEFFNDDGTQKVPSVTIQDLIRDRVAAFRIAVRDARDNQQPNQTPAQRWAHLTRAEKLEIKALAESEGL